MTDPRSRRPAALAAVLAVLVLSGCGGEEHLAVAVPARTPALAATPAATGGSGGAEPDPDGLRPAPLRTCAAAGDEFADPSALTGWRLSRGRVISGAPPQVGVTGGMLRIVSAHSAWFQTDHGLGLARRCAGDFTATLRVRPSGVDGGVPTVDWSLTGLMVRAPTTDPAAENWVHLSAGYVGRPVVERKDTRDTHSELVVADTAPGWIELRVVRSGAALVLLHRNPGKPWVFDYTYRRPDLPATVELLLTTQSGGESDHADLVSTMDWLRVRPTRLPAAATAALVEGDRRPPAALFATLTA